MAGCNVKAILGYFCDCKATAPSSAVGQILEGVYKLGRAEICYRLTRNQPPETFSELFGAKGNMERVLQTQKMAGRGPTE